MIPGMPEEIWMPLPPTPSHSTSERQMFPSPEFICPSRPSDSIAVLPMSHLTERR